jgi:hypothetical protein
MKYFVSKTSEGIFPQLLIETLKDLNTFIIFDSVIRSKQAVSFWMGFKSQKYRTELGDYYNHEKECKNTAIQALIAITIGLKESTTSLIEYCNTADKLLANKYEGMMKYLSQGKTIRTNHFGGYSPYEEGMYPANEMIDVSEEEQVKSFILNGQLNIPMSINSKAIVIENSDWEPESLIKSFKKLKNLTDDDIQVFNTFKLKTILWKEEDYIKFFKNGIENGLEYIAFESSFQDMPQFRKLKNLMEALMAKSPKPITVCVRRPSLISMKNELEALQKESKNIIIEFI